MNEKGHTRHTLFQSKGPKNDPCSTPTRKCFQSLKDELSFGLYFLLLRKLEVGLMDLQSKPCAFSLSQNKSRGRKVNALDSSTNKASHFLYWPRCSL